MLIPQRSCDSHQLDEMQAQLNTVLGLRRSSSLVSLAGSINTQKVYRNLCKGLFDSGVTAEIIKSKEKEIHNIFKPPNATTNWQYQCRPESITRRQQFSRFGNLTSTHHINRVESEPAEVSLGSPTNGFLGWSIDA